MAYYLWTGSYSPEAVKAMVDSPQDREAAARALIEGAGGKLHACFAALGDFDIMVICEMPDDVSVAAVSMVAGATGALTNGKTTKLLTMADFTEAMKKAGAAGGGYRPPQG